MESSNSTKLRKVIVDNKIPFIRKAIEQIADAVVYLPGREFTPEAVRDTDALIIRTRTCCNRRLLEGSRVKFIATATIGFDHIDTDYCRRAGIAWGNAPGCNSASVAQYMQSALLLLQQEKGIRLEGKTLGVVGVGNVGSKVVQVARELGMKVLLNDPPRQKREGDKNFCPLGQLTEACDVITFHTPLVREGRFRTFHLADAAFFSALKRHPAIVNTSRGEVIETAALLRALEERRVSAAVIDVWENEPDIDRTLLQKAFLATPHIAGYSADGKANATRMALDNLCRHFNLHKHYDITAPQPTCPIIIAATPTGACLQMYDPRKDSDALKANPLLFEKFREEYPLRREKEAYRIVIHPQE